MTRSEAFGTRTNSIRAVPKIEHSVNGHMNQLHLTIAFLFFIQEFELDVLEEAYTTEHWLVRIYKVKDLENRGT